MYLFLSIDKRGPSILSCYRAIEFKLILLCDQEKTQSKGLMASSYDQSPIAQW